MKSTKLTLSLVAFCAAALLQGCGGGSATTAAVSTSVGGVAAIGAPISSGSINLIGANGSTALGTINESGSYSVDTNGLTFPILVRVEGVSGGQTAIQYTAINEAGGTINANPVTTAIVTLAMGQDAGVVYENADVAKIALLTTSAIANASSSVNTALNAARTAVGMTTTEDVNFLSGSFTANKTGLDQILDLVKVRVNADLGISITNKTGDAAITVAQPTTTGGVPAASGTLGSILSVNTSAIDTLGSAFSTQLANLTANFGGQTPAAQSLFDDQFKHGGMSATNLIAEIRNMTELSGATFLPSNVRNCTGAGTSADNFVCDAIFTIKYTDGGLESFGFPVKRQADNSWKFYGNQAPTDAFVNPIAWRTADTAGTVTSTKTGFNVSVLKVNGNFVTSSGNTIAQTKIYFGGDTSGTAISTLYATGNGNCNGTEYMVVSNNNSNCGNFIELTDAQIDSLRTQIRPKVTLQFLDSSSGDLGTYTTYLEAAPLKVTEVANDRFATIAANSWASFRDSVTNSDTNTTMSIALQKSASVALEDLVGVQLDGGAIPFNTIRQNTTFNGVTRDANRVGLIAVTRDSEGHVFWYQRNTN